MKINNIFTCTQEEFNNSKSRTFISLICTQCNNYYSRTKKSILDTFVRYNTYPQYCSQQCSANFKKQQHTVNTTCSNCNKNINKLLNQSLKYKNSFCSNSCKATFSNKNKTTGTRRSKLEIFIEQELSKLYPNLEILYSSKEIIQSELDIYIPSLKLAFEIQGIFHYEPIYGQEKLNQIQKNDLEKIQKCKELGIKLICIDTRNQKRFTEKSSKKYLEQIQIYL